MSDTEYQKEYDAAMAKLEADASGKSTTTASTTTSEAKTTDAPLAKDAKTEAPDIAAEMERLRKETESNAKALKDTKAAFTRTSQELAALKREKEQEKHAAARPAILDANPGLEEAIRHVKPDPKPDPMAQVAGVIEKAIPDLERMLDDAEFKAKVDAARPSDGAWADPLIAIRDITAVRSDFIRDKAVSTARADFEKKSKKLGAMEVDGGTGGAGGSDTKQVDAAKAVWAMSATDFAKQRAKTLGYTN